MKNFDDVVQEMQRHSMKVPAKRFVAKFDDAKKILENALSYFLTFEDRSLLWLPEYDEVADWLSDTKGKGLYLYGNCGRGKSLIIRYVLPAIFLKYFNKVVSVYEVQEMNMNLDNLLTKCILSLDDIGTEEVANVFGNKRLAFAELVDAAEKEGKMLLISSNLQEDDLREMYGDRVVDRLRACTRRIPFIGESLRA